MQSSPHPEPPELWHSLSEGARALLEVNQLLLSRALLQRMPRGDGHLRQKMVKDVLTKVRARVLDELLQGSIKFALAEFERKARKNAGAKARWAKIRNVAERLATNRVAANFVPWPHVFFDQQNLLSGPCQIASSSRATR